ncbi:MAG: glycosyltransferase [bacterium]|nr:glycosyltransferase [bacterium]
MNVLILNHEFPPIGGGAGNACAHTAQELVPLGVQTTVLTSAYQDLPRRETCNGVTILRVPAIRTRQLEASPAEIASYTASALVASLSHVGRNRPDLIHAYFGLPAGAIAWALKGITRIPYLISFRGRDVHGGKSMDSAGITGPMRALSRLVWSEAGALVANSNGLRDIALRVSPGTNVSVIPNGVDTHRFTPGQHRKDGPLRLLFVGRLEPYKGIEFLLQALKQIHADHPVQLRIVGDGSLRNQLPETARALGINHCTEFIGPVPAESMPNIYQEADLFVLPALVEGMPNVILEAMAAGLPVLATQIPGSEELVLPGRTGLLVPPADPHTLADSLVQLLSNPNLREQMGHAARQDAESRSWTQVARTYLRLYQQILSTF